MIRTRIAPSPTGDPHVGTVYIALFNMVFAKHFGGQFILRIEDTDTKRSLPVYEENIYKALEWSNITWDEGPDKGGEYGPYRQSERLPIYQKYAQILLDKGLAYKCFATPEELKEMREIAHKLKTKSGYDRRYRNLSKEEAEKREKEGQSYVIRLKVPLIGECVFEDAIKGRITCPWADVDDQVLIKSNGFPTYHFAVVVDDYLMKISHVIRGDEWIASTPKHVFLYEAFGWKQPVYIHMPLLLGKDGKKLSKRKNPTSVFYFKDCGYLPEALINFLSLMGYNIGTNQEIYSVEELIRSFDTSRFGKSGAFFDRKKLDWINQKYIIEQLSEKDLLKKLQQQYFNEDFLNKLMPLAHSRIKTFGDFMDLCGFFFINQVQLSKDLLCPKSLNEQQSALILQAFLWALETNNDWDDIGSEKASHETAEIFSVHYKKIMIPLLFATIMGKLQGPPLFKSISILGKEKVRARILEGIEFLGGISNKKMVELKKGYDKKDCKSLFQSLNR